MKWVNTFSLGKNETSQGEEKSFRNWPWRKSILICVLEVTHSGTCSQSCTDHLQDKIGAAFSSFCALIFHVPRADCWGTFLWFLLVCAYGWSLGYYQNLWMGSRTRFRGHSLGTRRQSWEWVKLLHVGLLERPCGITVRQMLSELPTREEITAEARILNLKLYTISRSKDQKMFRHVQ